MRAYKSKSTVRTFRDKLENKALLQSFPNGNISASFEIQPRIRTDKIKKTKQYGVDKKRSICCTRKYEATTMTENKKTMALAMAMIMTIHLRDDFFFLQSRVRVQKVRGTFICFRACTFAVFV
eukprot:GEMP01130998.1.p1 GENE.GEMP01130998.1~~GEMP01130998.1.p1  ORF type:complete len:123 (+),score=0.80 GEMP01130998.1:131-499(+)